MISVIAALAGRLIGYRAIKVSFQPQMKSVMSGAHGSSGQIRLQSVSEAGSQRLASWVDSANPCRAMRRNSNGEDDRKMLAGWLHRFLGFNP